jgi:hypothetical protein
VLGMPVEEFRTTLHRARGALLRHCSRPPAVGALDSAR